MEMNTRRNFVARITAMMAVAGGAPKLFAQQSAQAELRRAERHKRAEMRVVARAVVIIFMKGFTIFPARARMMDTRRKITSR